MSGLRESGTLPVGVEVDGVLHREFVLRPRLVRDTVEALEDPRCADSEAYRGVALTARQIAQLGTLPAEKIDIALVLDMLDVDLGEIMAAADRLERRLLSFRGPGAGATQAASGPAAGGGTVPAGA